MKKFIAPGVGCVLLLQMIVAHAETWALRGTLLTPDSTVENGLLVIDDEKIGYAGKDTTLPYDAKTIPVSGIVLPGFIDLHNHLTWNVFPRWRPARKFSNRYEWQELPEY